MTTLLSRTIACSMSSFEDRQQRHLRQKKRRPAMWADVMALGERALFGLLAERKVHDFSVILR